MQLLFPVLLPNISIVFYRSYDFQSILNIASLVYSFTGCAPAALWFLLRQYEASETRAISLVATVCVYGYSMIFFLPAVVRVNSS